MIIQKEIINALQSYTKKYNNLSVEYILQSSSIPSLTHADESVEDKGKELHAMMMNAISFHEKTLNIYQ